MARAAGTEAGAGARLGKLAEGLAAGAGGVGGVGCVGDAGSTAVCFASVAGVELAWATRITFWLTKTPLARHNAPITKPVLNTRCPELPPSNRSTRNFNGLPLRAT